MQNTPQQAPPQDALADARAQLFLASLHAQQAHALTPELLLRVQLALAAGRSSRCSDAARRDAARHCLLLVRELERRTRCNAA